jgi:hypothetical protein
MIKPCNQSKFLILDVVQSRPMIFEETYKAFGRDYFTLSHIHPNVTILTSPLQINDTRLQKKSYIVMD